MSLLVIGVTVHKRILLAKDRASVGAGAVFLRIGVAFIRAAERREIADETT